MSTGMQIINKFWSNIMVNRAFIKPK